ncbi:hypothetical protein M3Y94_00208300 [Aphelenchoides besseyi]|nr:hypothetical protein M3Y94_00208300 [Aphelenchoides besseyi]KAI6236649.1 hypothetical protein M3Y95_00180000 [Aphelenchoides besseyi]
MSATKVENGNSDEYHPLQPLHTVDPEAFFSIEDQMALALTSDVIRSKSAQLISGIRMATTSNPPNLSEAKFLTLQLRQLNRLSNFRNRRLKEQILTAQHESDLVFLTFNNLANEISHLKRTISSTLNFRSADEKLELVPVEEFIVEAPKIGMELDEAIKTDAHKLRMARLNFELKQREQMCETQHELEIRKAALGSDIMGKEFRLSQIPTQIRLVRNAAKTLGDILGTRKAVRVTPEIKQKLQLLPTELKMLRLHCEVYSEWYPSDLLLCSCDGDENAVVAFEVRQRNGSLDKMNNIAQENRMETEEMSEDVVQTIEQVRGHLLEPHPMALLITIPCNGLQVTIHFHYFPDLRCATIKSNMKGKVHINELFLSQHLFDDLYYEDAGEICPNEVGNMLLNLCETSIRDHIKSIGKMYSFVQALVGTPNETEKSLPQFQRVSAFVRAARQRLFDRYELSKTLQQLESTSYEKAFPTEHVQKYSNRHQSRMSSFTINYNPSISAFPQKDRWKFTPTSAENADEKLARGFLLQFNVECTPLALNVLIFIPYAYPRVYPTVHFIMRNKPISSQLANALKDFEKAINLRIPPKAREVGVDIVTFQVATILHRLPVVFDWEKENGTEIRIGGRLHAPTLSRILYNR